MLRFIFWRRTFAKLVPDARRHIHRLQLCIASVTRTIHATYLVKPVNVKTVIFKHKCCDPHTFFEFFAASYKLSWFYVSVYHKSIKKQTCKPIVLYSTAAGLPFGPSLTTGSRKLSISPRISYTGLVNVISQRRSLSRTMSDLYGSSSAALPSGGRRMKTNLHTKAACWV